MLCFFLGFYWGELKDKRLCFAFLGLQYSQVELLLSRPPTVSRNEFEGFMLGAKIAAVSCSAFRGKAAKALKSIN